MKKLIMVMLLMVGVLFSRDEALVDKLLKEFVDTNLTLSYKNGNFKKLTSFYELNVSNTVFLFNAYDVDRVMLPSLEHGLDPMKKVNNLSCKSYNKKEIIFICIFD